MKFQVVPRHDELRYDYRGVEFLLTPEGRLKRRDDEKVLVDVTDDFDVMPIQEIDVTLTDVDLLAIDHALTYSLSSRGHSPKNPYYYNRQTALHKIVAARTKLENDEEDE